MSIYWRLTPKQVVSKRDSSGRKTLTRIRETKRVINVLSNQYNWTEVSYLDDSKALSPTELAYTLFHWRKLYNGLS